MRPVQPPADWQARGPSAATRWLAILLLIVAGALVWVVLRDRANRAAELPPAPPAEPRSITPRGDLASDEKSTIELFRQVSPSVVQVTSVERRTSRLSMNVFEIPQGTGSGFIWDDGGHVVTNFHVIEHGTGAQVTLSDGTLLHAEVVGTAPDKDLAVLKISEPPNGKVRAIPVGTSNNLLVGQKVFAIGNPFGLDQTLTTGIISGLGREITAETGRPIQDMIQTDAAINRGNSGGPLLDSAGRVIGINTAIFSPSGTSAGIGFAVPVDTINRIVPQLISHGRVVKPGLGIHIGTDQLAARMNIRGVLVIEVPEGSAAEKAGLVGFRTGSDGHWVIGDVIVGIDEKAVTNSLDLFRALDEHAVGDKVNLKVDRSGDKRNVDVTLQAIP
jgi:S1-C subfamily serine protease